VRSGLAHYCDDDSNSSPHAVRNVLVDVHNSLGHVLLRYWALNYDLDLEIYNNNNEGGERRTLDRGLFPNWVGNCDIDLIHTSLHQLTSIIRPSFSQILHHDALVIM
jgi:hypothetical protein